MALIEMDQREIGPQGTAARVIAGLLAIAIPVAHGLEPWDLAAGLLVFPLIAWALYSLIAAAYDRYRSHSDGHRGTSPSARSWLINVAVLVLLLAIATGLTYLTPVDGGAIWLFFGASLLVVAARGDAGCEVLAIVNALAGRRDTTGCVAFSPVDALEARRGTR